MIVAVTIYQGQWRVESSTDVTTGRGPAAAVVTQGYSFRAVIAL